MPARSMFNTAPVLSVSPPESVSVPAPPTPGAMAPPLLTVTAMGNVAMPPSAPVLFTESAPVPLMVPVNASVPPLMAVAPL